MSAWVIFQDLGASAKPVKAGWNHPPSTSPSMSGCPLPQPPCSFIAPVHGKIPTPLPCLLSPSLISSASSSSCIYTEPLPFWEADSRSEICYPISSFGWNIPILCPQARHLSVWLSAMRQDKAELVTRLWNLVGGEVQVDFMLVGPWLELRARGRVQAAAWSVCSRTSPESPLPGATDISFHRS